MTIQKSGPGHFGDMSFLTELRKKQPYGLELGIKTATLNQTMFLTFGQSEEF